MPSDVSPTMPRTGTTRSPIRAWLLSVTTLGTYAVAHHYTVNRELRDFGVEVRPTWSVLALVPGVLVLAPPFVTLWRTASRIGVAQETVGLEPSSRGWCGAVSFVGFAFVGYHQREINRVWRADPDRPPL